MHGISYRPTDLSLLKGFFKIVNFEDFHNFHEGIVMLFISILGTVLVVFLLSSGIAKLAEGCNDNHKIFGKKPPLHNWTN